MINFAEVNKSGEEWELFARDFLREIGFFIDSSVDRGPDGKKDLIVSESLQGNLNNYKFKWLVSCKHYANRQSSNSVKEEDEPNILERVKSFNCDGFIGFYSTVPSSGLNTRLNQLKQNGDLKDYRVFDYKLIENYLIRVGYSDLLMRYFPDSYKQVRPLHQIFHKYYPLKCNCCEKDLLENLFREDYSGLIGFVYDDIDIDNSNGETVSNVVDFYWACKGYCDDQMQKRFKGKYVPWNDISDLIMPAQFVDFVFAIMNELEQNKIRYSTKSYNKLKYFIAAISQKAMREMTENEKERFGKLQELPF